MTESVGVVYVSNKEAHAISCGIKRHIEAMKRELHIKPTLTIRPGSDVNVVEWMKEMYKGATATLRTLTMFETLYADIRKVIQDNNNVVITQIENLTVNTMIAQINTVDATIANIDAIIRYVGSVPENTIRQAGLCAAKPIESTHTETICNYATEQEATGLKVQKNKLQSTRVKLQKRLDRANLTLQVGLAPEQIAVLEGIGLM